MKKKIEIVSEHNTVVQITKSELISKLEKDPIGTLTSYDLDDDTLFDIIEFVPVDIFYQTIDPSEELIERLIEIDYIKNEDLHKLSLTSISKMSQEFLKTKIEFLNFDRIILNFSSSDDEYFTKNDPQPYIEMSNLHGPYFWRILSSNKLPKNVILNNKDSFDWLLLGLNNNFSDFSEEEFSIIKPYLVDIKFTNTEYNFFEKSITDITEVIDNVDKSIDCKSDKSQD